jgi:nuclear pore complex protein Nup205
LSDELNLNEIECVRLLVDANREVFFAESNFFLFYCQPCLDCYLTILHAFTVVILQWVLYGREPLEIYRLAAGLWYMERRDLITSLYILLRVIY